LDGVAFTGGEPLLHRELPDLLRRIRALGFAAKVDTNGAHPDPLRQILEEGLADYVAMDVKNSPAKYAATCGVEQVDMDAVRESVALLMGSATDYEFRTTVVKEFHEESDFEEIGRMITGAKHYFLQCFTDRDSVPFGGLHAPSRQELERFAAVARRFVPDTRLRGVD